MKPMIHGARPRAGSLVLAVAVGLGIGLPHGSPPMAGSPRSGWRGVEGDSPATILAAQQFINVPADMALQPAIDAITDGGVILVAPGTYAPPSSPTCPSGCFLINNEGKGFTIRGLSPGTPVLTGENAHEVLVFANGDLSFGGPVTFENLRFANGRAAQDGRAGGVTMFRSEGTFIDCQFDVNEGAQPGSGGGGAVLTGGSRAMFVDSSWSGNSARNYGGAIAVEDGSTAVFHRSIFSDNHTNRVGHSSTSAGGAIHVGNSFVAITNSRFEMNEAGYVGGAVYVIGSWADPVTNPRAEVYISNSTFSANASLPHPSVVLPAPSEGGAVHAENQTRVRIHNSRFFDNFANTGGAVNLYRAEVEVVNSEFSENRATGIGPANGFGGSISAISNDTGADGSVNRPPARLTVRKSSFSMNGGSASGESGGGIYAAGDSNRMYGQNGVGQMGAAGDNRAVVTITQSTFYDMNVTDPAYPGGSTAGTGVGGGILLDLVQFELDESLLAGSDAIGLGAGGGGLAILNQSTGWVTRSTFAGNTSTMYGGAVFAQGSDVEIGSSSFFENEVSPGTAEPIGQSYGAALFSTPDADPAHNLPATGLVHENVFSANIGLPVFDDDRYSGPINGMQYSGNQIFSNTFGNAIYSDAIGGYCCKTVGELNVLVVARQLGVGNTEKAPFSDNQALALMPSLGAVRAAPELSLATGAPGDSVLPTESRLTYAWSGSVASLDGAPLSQRIGTLPVGSGTYGLEVDGASMGTAAVWMGPDPRLSLSGAGWTINWSVAAGTYWQVYVDQGATYSNAPSGTAVLPASRYEARVYLAAEEGGTIHTIGLPFVTIVVLPLVMR